MEDTLQKVSGNDNFAVKSLMEIFESAAGNYFQVPNKWGSQNKEEGVGEGGLKIFVKFNEGNE